ncbi:cholecystokinin receptor-like [Myripristis murdjan]|uniref:cholecystokinin receptor-like n=1 Tax=Myripristis murdjan TaxID=586833 RepID=UPI0011764543|nr:cholecystokinin receptor-like [Myripristis murdjan]
MRSEPAPTWATGNNTVWEEYTAIAFLVAHSFILLITSFVGTAANLFVIWAVHHQKSLQTWNNALLVNLAVIDILRCAVDCPILLTIVTTVYQGGHMDELICNAQVASFSFSCCLQLLTLACISAERYQAIAQPFKTSQRRKRIIVLIPLTWTLAILVAVICLAFVRDSPVYVKCRGSQWETMSSYDTFGVYILIPLWTSCFGVITGFYASIFMLVRAHSRKIFDKGSFPPREQDIAKNADEQKNEVATVGEDAHSKSDQNHIQSEPVAKVDLPDKPEDCSTLLIDLEQVQRSSGETESVAKVDQVSASPQTANPTLATETVEQQAQVDGAVCMMPSFANKERANKKKESKMAKRSGYIIITFLLFWLPLITTIMVNFLVYKNKPSGMMVIQDVEILSVSIACMTSLSDPIIYAAVNPQFRTEFYRLKNRFKSYNLCNKK